MALAESPCLIAHDCANLSTPQRLLDIFMGCRKPPG